MADIAYNHIGKGLNYLSFGGMPCDPPGTQDGRPVKATMRPSPNLPPFLPWEAVMRQLHVVSQF